LVGQLGTLLEPELFPTRTRGTWIGMIRLIAWGVYIVLTYYLLNTLNTYQYLLVNLILYAIGALVSIAWYIWGVETRGVPVSILDEAMG